MAHYAFLNESNIVTHVIVGKDESDIVEDITDWEEFYSNEVGQVCKRTSYNTYANTHLTGGTPFRYNYASEGFVFDASKGEDGAFIPIKPFDSWILNEEKCIWQAPVEKPEEIENELYYKWDEDSISWVIDPVISK
jgi:hypothetical protein